ncbi:MAG: sugar phosphate isomerase/epimerase [Treponema sp.]|jgi:sugar phosphate isomerase/epimerase|nr:sugar phosphate isomerase/epimerase [Treponema sp.]
MQIGVSSYSFSKLFKQGAYTLFDAVEYAGKTGFDAIEFTDLAPQEGRGAADLARDLGAACKTAGLDVACYAVGADFLYGSGRDMKKETERIKGCVDIARLLGASRMRHDSTWSLKDAFYGRTWKDAVKAIAPAIREVTEYAEGFNIKTMTENHGYFFQDSYRMEELVLAVDHPNYGLLVDIGNFMCADETSVTALARVMPYAFHVHAKDFLWKSGTEPKPDDSWFPTRAGNHLRGTILGHGVVSVSQCLRYIKNSGYQGAVSLEFEGSEEPLEAISRGYEFLSAWR